MNLSLKNRVFVSFLIANVVILIMTFTVFNFLNSLSREIENVTSLSNRASLLTDEIRISAVSILKYQRKIVSIKIPDQVTIKKLTSLCEGFTSQLHTLDSLYKNPEIKKVLASMLSYVDSLQLVLSKSSLFYRDSVGVTSVRDLSDKILDSFTDFQDIQYQQSKEHDRQIKEIINETKKNMMITLIIGFLGTILLGLVIPSKIALPFKKIKDAIRELQDNNFDVSIYYNQDDEIGEIAKEINKMVLSIKHFDELRTDRIGVELRKFNALANLVRRHVIVSDAEGRIIFMNSKLYSLLQVQSEDVHGKQMKECAIPKSIIDCYDLAITRRAKIDNVEVVIPAKGVGSLDLEEGNDASVEDLSVGSDNVKENLFEGYATVMPIRGKESSLDYYLMVMSSELFSS